MDASTSAIEFWKGNRQGKKKLSRHHRLFEQELSLWSRKSSNREWQGGHNGRQPPGNKRTSHNGTTAERGHVLHDDELLIHTGGGTEPGKPQLKR